MSDEKIESLKKELEDNNLTNEKDRIEFLSLMLDSSEVQDRVKARELCYKWLNEDSSISSIRLLLAKSFYLDGYSEFATRELKTIQHFGSTPSIDRLIELISKGAPSYLDKSFLGEGEIKVSEVSKDREEGVDIFAEIDIDTEFIDKETKDS